MTNTRQSHCNHLHSELTVLPFPLYMLCLFICRNAVAAPSLCACSSLDFHHFPASCHLKRLSFPQKITLLTKYIFGFHPFLSKRHFMTTLLHLSPPLLIPILSDLSSFTPVFHSFPHFLVLTSLSIRALRVLCTSSPSLSISAFKRSFCSVSSCTFLSFSCSLSLRLFLADE